MLLMIHECNYISQSILSNMPSEWGGRMMRTQQALISLIHEQKAFIFQKKCHKFNLKKGKRNYFKFIVAF